MGLNGGLTGPASKAVDVNLGSDTAGIDGQNTRGLYVGGAGNLKVDLVDGGTGIVLAVLAGSYHPLQVSKVYSTANGTTATGIKILY